MTIHLPNDLENSIHAAVQTGRYASLDDAMAAAARLLLRELKQGEPSAAAVEVAAAPPPKPIWEVFQEISASIPDEEWANVPVDGAEQHDHYIYGTPKRPAP